MQQPNLRVALRNGVFIHREATAERVQQIDSLPPWKLCGVPVGDNLDDLAVNRDAIVTDNLDISVECAKDGIILHDQMTYFWAGNLHADPGKPLCNPFRSLARKRFKQPIGMRPKIWWLLRYCLSMKQGTTLSGIVRTLSKWEACFTPPVSLMTTTSRGEFSLPFQHLRKLRPVEMTRLN
jgi:hypothetical protein